MASRKYKALTDRQKARYARWLAYQQAAGGKAKIVINTSSDAKVSEFLASEATLDDETTAEN